MDTHTAHSDRLTYGMAVFLGDTSGAVEPPHVANFVGLAALAGVIDLRLERDGFGHGRIHFSGGLTSGVIICLDAASAAGDAMVDIATALKLRDVVQVAVFDEREAMFRLIHAGPELAQKPFTGSEFNLAEFLNQRSAAPPGQFAKDDPCRFKKWGGIEQ